MSTSQEIAGPSVATLKRLFAVSSNRCAFPKCPQPLVDASSGKTIARICHIKARSKGGPRYDPEQSDVQRHSFENLILLCPVHHDVIDADELAYTVERLRSMKEAHEAKSTSNLDLDDGTASRLLTSVHDNMVTDGSIILATNISHSQIAHQIINNAIPPRRISASAATELIAALRTLPPEHARLETPFGQPEAVDFAESLRGPLQDAGWRVRPGMIRAEYLPNAPRGVVMVVSGQRPAIDALGTWLLSHGFEARGEIAPDKCEGFARIIVGVNQ